MNRITKSYSYDTRGIYNKSVSYFTLYLPGNTLYGIFNERDLLHHIIKHAYRRKKN